MLSRQATWQMLASAASLLVALHSFAQPALPPKTPATPATGSASTVQIIPVSLSNESVAATVNGEKFSSAKSRKSSNSARIP